MARRSNKARRTQKARPRGILELTKQGFGFVKTAEGEFFIPARKTNGAFPGDLVEIAPTRSSEPAGGDRKPTARVSKVLMRATNRIVGRYEIAEPFGVVVPEDPAIAYDIFTLHRENPGVKEGDIVEVEMVEYPTRNSAATGKVVAVLGGENDSSLLVDLVVARHGLATSFSEEALSQASACTLDVERALLDGYADLRDELIFTIDPVDARDFDDALSISFDGQNYQLGVHIADVSAYVAYGSLLDEEARTRGTSVYLVDRVLPMLPEALSNSLCSLAPGVERLALSVQASVSPQGKVQSYTVHPSVIRSQARLSYDQAQAILDASEGQEFEAMKGCEQPQGAKALDKAFAEEQLAPRVRMACELSQALFAKRYAAGCMDFNRAEAKVVLDASGKPVDVNLRVRTQATQLVEECMILANNLVAQWLSENETPCIYRVHGAPSPDSLEALYVILQEFSYLNEVDGRAFCGGNPHEIQKVLSLSKGRLEEELVNALLLRSMKRAHYTPAEEPHYGVALEQYCHFTSPIRRYPDLMVHRMVKDRIFGHSSTYQAQKDALGPIAEHSSSAERTAEKAAWESQEIKLIELLEQQVGSEFRAIISGVSTFGLSVRLENTAQGFVDMQDLGEYFAFDPARYTLTGTDSGQVYRLGAPLQVVLVQSNARQRVLQFKLS